MSSLGHGTVGLGSDAFTEILPIKEQNYDPKRLAELAIKMQGGVDPVTDIPDAEENLLMPAGYTYFGQFIDHDLTFDNTSSLNPKDIKKNPGEKLTEKAPSNLRTPRFDLDSLYGDGPDAMPYMYAEDGASLIFKDSFANQCQTSYDQATQDLLRSPNGRAIIGDKRNDENSIITQIQLAFIKYHNEVVKHLSKKNPTLAGTELFDEASQEVRWTYQKLVIEDFLPRIVKDEVLEGLKNTTPAQRKNSYVLYLEGNRSNLPREFVVAAFRFGHSAVRTGYRLNKETRLNIFPSSEQKSSESSLLGFEPLPKSHVIDDWKRFFPDYAPSNKMSDAYRTLPVNEDRPKRLKDGEKNDDPNPAVRLQFAYKLDPTLVDPLSVLPTSTLPTSRIPGGVVQEVENAIDAKLPVPNRPSLALLNLIRGSKYQVQSGQEIVEQRLKAKGVKPLGSELLVTRQAGCTKGTFKFTKIHEAFHGNTPLWFYILAEAQASIIAELKLELDKDYPEDILFKGAGAKTQLGWVGGRIVAEVFYALIDEDPESYQNKAPINWKPILGGDKTAIFLNLIKFI